MFFEREEEIAALGTGRVLLLDDERMTREVTTGMLQYLGYTVEAVSRGEEAVSLYRIRQEDGRPFDAVILDIVQPDGIGGEETLKRLMDYNPAVKGIVSSGYTFHKVMRDHKAYGFRAALPKPYGIRQLGDVLRQVLG